MNNVLNRMENKWDQGASNYDNTHVNSENNELWLKVISETLGAEYDKSVLDVGTGTGFIVLKAAQLGFKCTGLDMSEGMMSEAKRHAAELGVKIGFVKSYVEDTPFEDGSFDLITNRSLMWTLTDPQKALAEWRRVLKPSGKIFCFCHISQNRAQHNHYEHDIEDVLPLKTAPAEKYVDEIEKAGFSDVKAVPLPQLPCMHGGASSEDNGWYVFAGRA